jgi:hypothetical protein
MKANRVLLTVLLVVLVVGLLAAGGWALYRLGYAHGGAAAAADVLPEGLFRQFGGRMPHMFDGRFPGGFRQGVIPWGSMHQPYLGFPFLSWGLGALLVVGVIALVVIAVNGLVSAGRGSPPPSPPDRQESS